MFVADEAFLVFRYMNNAGYSRVNYLLQIPFTIPEIILVSLLYLFLDIYPAVKSFRAMLTTASFLVLWDNVLDIDWYRLFLFADDQHG
jgi:hypothetical protein